MLTIIAAVLLSPRAAGAYVDNHSLISEAAILGNQRPVTDVEVKTPTVKQLLSLPVNFRSLILINRRLVHEAKNQSFIKFVGEVRTELPKASRLNARLLAEAIVIYCEKSIVYGNLKYSPNFYKNFYSHAAKARFSLTAQEQQNDVMVFLDLEGLGTSGGGMNWERALELSKKSSAATRVNLAKRAVLGHVSGIKDREKLKKFGKEVYSRERVDALLRIAWESKAFSSSVAVLKSLVLAVNGETAAAKKLANQYRTNEALNIHYREGLLELSRTGKWQKLREAMNKPFPIGWKRGD